MGVELELEKQLKLEDLEEGKIFRDIQLITERKDVNERMKEMTTTSKTPASKIIQNYYYFYVVDGNVSSIHENGCGEIEDKEEYNAAKQKLEEAGLLL